MMKRMFAVFAVAALGAGWAGAARWTAFGLEGDVQGGNAVFTLSLGVEDLERESPLEVLRGEVTVLESSLPGDAALARAGDVYSVVRPAGGGWWSGGRKAVSGTVMLKFAARVRPSGGGMWDEVCFNLPVLPVRKVSVRADDPSLEMWVRTRLGAVKLVEDGDGPKGVASAQMSPQPEFVLSWRPDVRLAKSELVASCDINTVAVVSPGALRVDALLSYRVAQGELSELVVEMPPSGVNVLSVSGADIQDWRVESPPMAGQPAAGAVSRLHVQLARAQREAYALQVVCECPLGAFPCVAALPVLSPQGVIRVGGDVLLGTDSAVRLQVGASAGLTQVEVAAFPKIARVGQGGDAQAGMSAPPLPSKGVFAWQYAALPFELKIAADDIATAVNAEMNVLVSVADAAVSVEASVQMDVRDAPAREVRIQIPGDARWAVVSVSGRDFAENDVDVVDVNEGVRSKEEGVSGDGDGKIKNEKLREIVIPFRKPVSGTVVAVVRLEAALSAFAEDGKVKFPVAVPRLSVKGAKSQRGYLVAAAERGMRLVPSGAAELSDIHTASAPFKAEGAQLAYRFREANWALGLAFEYAQSAIHSEVFHLVSIGQGVVYVSAAVNGHVSGAPVQVLRFRVPEAIQGLDVTGVGIDAWGRKGDVCTVRLVNRILGDFTLLLSYDHPVSYDNAELTIGQIETLDTASELGYMAVATSAPLDVKEVAAQGGDAANYPIRIPRDELPEGYAATVTAPVVGAWKYTRPGHAVALRVQALDSRPPIDQVVDFLSLESSIGNEGESITVATWKVKNTSRQYLEIQLPQNATVWKVRQGEDAAARDVPAQQTDDRLLVPVERPRNPNQAVSIEVTYAQPSASPRRYGSVSLTAPRLPGTPVTFATWRVGVDAHRAFASGAGGQMSLEQGYQKITPLGSVLNPFGNASSLNFYRTATLGSEPALTVQVRVVPGWLGGVNPPLMAACGVVALLGLVLAALPWRGRRFGLASAAASAFMAALLLPRLAPYAAGVGIVLFGVSVAVWVLRGIVRLFRRPASPSDDDDPPPLIDDDDDAPGGGPSAAATAAAVIALGLLALPLRAEDVEPGADAARPRPMPVLDSLRTEVVVPNQTLGEMANVNRFRIRWTLCFRTEQRDSEFVLFDAFDDVFAEIPDDTGRYRFRVSDDGKTALLNVRDKGEHRLVFDTRAYTKLNDPTTLRIRYFDALTATAAVTLPGMDLEVEGTGVLWKKIEADEGKTTVELVLGPGTMLGDAKTWDITWRPRARDTKAEKPVVYATLTSVAQVKPGVIETALQAAFNVVQGEARVFAVSLPDNMTVTDVKHPKLATWRFDPATRRVEAVMSQALTGAATLSITLQTACPPAPSELVLSAPSAENVDRQGGRIAIAAPESLLVRVANPEGVIAVDAADFRPLTRLAPDALRRTFRYDDPKAVRIPLGIEDVQPELNVQEAASFSLGDERNILSSTLQVSVTRAGVFGARLLLPDGYEIESLAGPAVSHWDDARAAGRGIEVWFTGRVLDTTPIHLVLSSTQRGVPPAFTVPHVTLHGARRHTGRIAISAERGIKLTVDKQDGVSLNRDEPQRGAALVFNLLRADWHVTLNAEVLPPVLKPDMLHRVDLAEGMLQHRIYAHYRIANAGVRFFRIRIPDKAATLTVSGQNIARVRALDDAAGPAHKTWEIELHGKVEGTYNFIAQYQEPYDAASGTVTIKPVTLLDTARQASWLAVTCTGRIEVAPKGEVTGLKADDARALPADFNAGDISSAILCYRALREDYALSLSVTRHAAASVLPAMVERVRLVSVISSGGRMLTQATLTLDPGHMRFLRVTLPGEQAALWSAIVNGAEVPVSVNAGALNIPLETATVGRRAEVVLIYADALAAPTLLGSHALRGPRFPDLPLRNIQWRFLAPPDYRYEFPDSAFQREDAAPRHRAFAKISYEESNRAQTKQQITQANSNLKSLDKLLETGQQGVARQMLQQAVTLSQAEESLNEDARVQFRNVVERQVKMGLVNSRAAMRAQNNIFVENDMDVQSGWNGGNFDEKYARQVEDNLGALDNAGLNLVARKLVDVQAGAAAQGASIQVVMPEHGEEFTFTRPLQNELGGELVIPLRAIPARAWGTALALWPLLPGIPLLWLTLNLLLGPRRRTAK